MGALRQVALRGQDAGLERRHGLAEQVALELVATLVQQAEALRLGFDALGGDLDAEILTQRGDRHQDRLGAFAGIECQVRSGGTDQYWRISGRPIRDDAGTPAGFVGTVRDITAEKEAKNQIIRLAHRDTLTGLYNRASFTERLLAHGFVADEAETVMAGSVGHLTDEVEIPDGVSIKQALAPDDIARGVNDLFDRHGPMPIAADIGDDIRAELIAVAHRVAHRQA